MKSKKELHCSLPIVILIFIFSLTLAFGCQSEALSTPTKKPQAEGKKNVQQESIEESEEVEVEKPIEKPQEEKSSAEEEVSAEVTQVIIHIWDSLDSIWGHGAVEITNTGNTLIRIGEDIDISIYDLNDNVIGTIYSISPVPEVIKPGEKAYCSGLALLEKIDNADIEVYAKANIDYGKTDIEGQNLDVQEIGGFEGDWADYFVVGEVINTSDEKADDIRICIALFDENNILLGVITPWVDATLNPGDSMAFEASFPGLPKEIGRKAKSFIGKAFNFN